MKHRFLIGNWKSNLTIRESREWFRDFHALSSSGAIRTDLLTIALAIPHTIMGSARTFIEEHELPIEVCGQDISVFGEGPYTGEVNARQMAEVARFVIVGHTERRTHFKENDAILYEKARQAKMYDLHVVYCVNSEHHAIPPEADIVSYEPEWAIGSGKPETPEGANDVARKIKARTGVGHVIYGGSVTDGNAGAFAMMSDIDGVLPGKASLDPAQFYRIAVALSTAR